MFRPTSSSSSNGNGSCSRDTDNTSSSSSTHAGNGGNSSLTDRMRGSSSCWDTRSRDSSSSRIGASSSSNRRVGSGKNVLHQKGFQTAQGGLVGKGLESPSAQRAKYNYASTLGYVSGVFRYWTQAGAGLCQTEGTCLILRMGKVGGDPFLK